MSSKHRHSDDDSSYNSYSDSSDSDYHSKHKRKKRKSKHKHKHKKRHKKHRKDKKSKQKKRSKSKHKHSKKRHRNHNDNSNINTNSHQPKHKKRKLNTDTNPCTKEEMFTNAKTILNMFCDNNDSIKEYVINIFTKLDNNEYVCISRENLQYQQPLKMIFTFLSLNTNDGFNYNKNDNHISLLSLFKSELNYNDRSDRIIETETHKNTENAFIGPAMPSGNYKKSEVQCMIPTVKVSENNNNASDIIGVTMPTDVDLLNNKYSSESEDDAYGPAIVNENDNKRKLQMAHTKIYNEMHKKIKGEEDMIDDLDDNEHKREDWMKIMPEFDKNTGIKRGFNMNENDSGNKIDKTWMETPNDKIKQMNERERRKKIQMETNQKLMKVGLPSVEEYRHDRIKEYVDNRIDIIEGDMERRKRNDEMDERKKERSLFEIHQEKLMNEYKEELKEWKRNKKKGKKGPKPVFKGAKQYEANASYGGIGGSMERYYNANNPTFKRSKLDKFVHGGSIDDY